MPSWTTRWQDKAPQLNENMAALRKYECWMRPLRAYPALVAYIYRPVSTKRFRRRMNNSLAQAQGTLDAKRRLVAPTCVCLLVAHLNWYVFFFVLPSGVRCASASLRCFMRPEKCLLLLAKWRAIGVGSASWSHLSFQCVFITLRNGSFF